MYVNGVPGSSDCAHPAAKQSASVFLAPILCNLSCFMLLAQILPCFLGNTSWGCWGASPGVGLLAGGVQPFSWASDPRCSYLRTERWPPAAGRELFQCHLWLDLPLIRLVKRGSRAAGSLASSCQAVSISWDCLGCSTECFAPNFEDLSQ